MSRERARGGAVDRHRRDRKTRAHLIGAGARHLEPAVSVLFERAGSEPAISAELPVTRQRQASADSAGAATTERPRSTEASAAARATDASARSTDVST